MHRYKFALFLILPLALFAYTAERNSWRPKTIELGGSGITGLFFSADGRYVVVNYNPSPSQFRHGDYVVAVFDRKAQRIVRKLPHRTGLFVVGQDNLVVVNGLTSVLYASRFGLPYHTEVYALHDGKLHARSPDHFKAYAALPDGKTLLGDTWPGNDSWFTNTPRPPEVLAWDFVAHPGLAPRSMRQNTNAQSTNVQTKNANPTILKPFAVLPSPPSPPQRLQVRAIECLADQQTLLISDYSNSISFPIRLKNTPGPLQCSTQLWNIQQKKSLLCRATTLGAGGLDKHLPTSTVGGLFALQEVGRLKIWNYHTGHFKTDFLLSAPNPHNPNAPPKAYVAAHPLALSPNGNLLAGAISYSKIIGLWDTGTGQYRRSLTGHKTSITCLTFSPDGKTLASGSEDGTVKLWRIK